MLTPKVIETVRFSAHRRPAPPLRPVPPVGAGGGRRHGGPLAAG